ncbi:SEC-C domain-containing protein [Mycolicibacterium flavescens]|uniref:SEC-C motif-containing protein n=1 Tax=Mycolicibacterium flavescens TaxID=1776 RepID=A0A1E3RM75_MYCFV|nr:SEC-C metal-binding domain-containing protein [Mycolicibacterium flavescens]MCV7281728.1 SEC-C domain-containing protein [Mycolicibacterium flavescens]ODQ90961.1 hypothetical protein BHQ18_09175 [Mycolicibacterium flavescens]
MTAAQHAIEAITRILAQDSPLDKDQIIARLRADSIDDSVVPWNLIDMDSPAAQLVDDRWVWLPALLTGRVFTHRLTAPEARHDMLTVVPDLSPIATLCERADYQRFADGSRAQIAVLGYDDELLDERGIPPEVLSSTVLLLDPGTLSGLNAQTGNLVGLRLTADGFVLDRVEVTAEHTAGQRLAAVLRPHQTTLLDAAVWTACATDPDLFTKPLPPLAEIVDAAGLPRRDEWVAPSGFDIDRWQFELRCELLAERHGIDADDAFAINALVQLHDRIELQLAESDDPVSAVNAEFDSFEQVFGPLAELGAVLADPHLAQILVAETIDTDSSGPDALQVLATTLERGVPRTARVACKWIRAVILQRIGDIAEAEQELDAAESLDPEWPLPLLELARIASDRGDAERGLSLLRRAGVESDHPLMLLLQDHRIPPRTDLGRNEPCWCGSGRKFKKCHLGREQLALAERVNWLYEKAIHHALGGGWRDVYAEASYERYRHTHELTEVFELGMADPLIHDVVLFEGGAFADFLDTRGSLLPDDERLLAEQWLLTDRSVFEVEAVEPGAGVTVRDLRTGDTHEVRERIASRQLKPGQLICARVLPTADSPQFYGGIEMVPLHERDALMDLLDVDPDPVELVAALSRRFAPPTLTNTEGEPLTACETTLRVSDPVAVDAALDDVYERATGAEPPRWHEQIETKGMPHVRATLVREGDTLQVETNSEPRMDRVLSTLLKIDPTMRVIDESRRAMPDPKDAAELAQNPGALEPDDPEVAAMLNAYIREYEAKWLDQNIPALDGHTPREAADDPTRRGDLIKLLDSFPADDGTPGRMSPERLRSALGLD